MWRFALRPGSFRGVPFDDYERIDRTGGRGVVVHNHPKGSHSTEDMGLKEKEFDLSVFVVGSTYMQKRDALIAALDGAGPGQLVIPTGGGGMCNVDSYTCSESIDEGGMCRFDIAFIRAGASPMSSPVSDMAGTMLSAVSSAVGTIVGAANRALGAVNTGRGFIR